MTTNKKVTYIINGEETDSFEAALFAHKILSGDKRRTKPLTIIERTTVERDVTPEPDKAPATPDAQTQEENP